MSHIYENYAKKICTILSTLNDQNDDNIVSGFDRIVVEPPRDELHGDLATNAALVMAKSFGITPLQLAEILKPHIASLPDIEHVAIVAPGFINICLKPGVWAHELKRVLKLPADGVLYDHGQGKKVNIEYVSTNPTGPMHIGHCRGAVVGDVLANILKRTGYQVVKEFYINDAGNQIDNLAQSVYQRYREILGHEQTAPLTYKGDYLIPLAQHLIDRVANQYIDCTPDVWLKSIKEQSIDYMMNQIKQDLALLNIYHDVFTSEANLLKQGAIDTAVNQLDQQGLIYSGVLDKPMGQTVDDWEPRTQTLFKATQFGDEIDRPLQKSDQTWTYFASDIAYHYQKFKSGADLLIDVLGADHGGYVKRIMAAVRALSANKATLKCVIVQMVKFIDKGQSLKMSKRAGNFITVCQAIDKVGIDVLRFIMLTRKADTPLDFDFDKVTEQTRDNPVFYAQYAYARCFSIKRHALKLFPDLVVNTDDVCQQDFALLITPEFMPLIKKLAQWPRILEQAAKMLEAHRLTYYILEIAGLFHNLWTQGRHDVHLKFIVPDDQNMTQRHYILIHAIIQIMDQCFTVLGINAPQEM